MMLMSAQICITCVPHEVSDRSDQCVGKQSHFNWSAGSGPAAVSATCVGAAVGGAWAVGTGAKGEGAQGAAARGAGGGGGSDRLMDVLVFLDRWDPNPRPPPCTSLLYNNNYTWIIRVENAKLKKNQTKSFLIQYNYFYSSFSNF